MKSIWTLVVFALVSAACSDPGPQPLGAHCTSAAQCESNNCGRFTNGGGGICIAPEDAGSDSATE